MCQCSTYAFHSLSCVTDEMNSLADLEEQNMRLIMLAKSELPGTAPSCLQTFL